MSSSLLLSLRSRARWKSI